MMSKRKILFSITAVLCFFCFSYLYADYGLRPGAQAPFFRVISGEGKALTLEDIKGKAAGIFYETTDVVRQNIQLKEELGGYYDGEPQPVKNMIMRLPVINCSKVFRPLAGIWRAQFRKHSKKEGITIYGDWNGKMFSDYNIQDGKSNVFLIDKKSIVRYYASGALGAEERRQIISLLKTLVTE